METGCCTKRVLLNILVVHVWIDLHAMMMYKFDHGVLRIEPTAVERCARKSTEFAVR